MKKCAIALLLAGITSLHALDIPKKKSTAAAQPVPVAPLPSMVLPEDPRPFTLAPEGANLTVEGADEELRSYSSLAVIFPTDMVPADKIDTEDAESPIVAWPDLDISFVWRTPSQGDLVVNGPLIPGQNYRFRLREGLTDLAGAKLSTDAWGVEMKTPAFSIIEENYGERESLNSRPQVPLEFNYPVRLEDAPQGMWIQNRATRERFPIEVLLNQVEGEMDTADIVEAADKAVDVTGFRVRPLKPLPVNGSYDLVVDDVRDALSGRGMSYPRVFPLGTTHPLQVEYVSARNFPLEKPRIDVKFRQLLGDGKLPGDALQITPAVPNLHLRQEGAFIIADGDFDPKQRYTVAISDKITGVGGYPLAKPEKWGATFHAKAGTILFPDEQIRERSRLGLAFSFYQVNTSELEWKLARVPQEKLPKVLKRKQEFDGYATDQNGDSIWTKEGVFKRKGSELLISTLGLDVVGSGKIPAADNDAEILRDIKWAPEDTAQLDGPMVLEVSGTDREGRAIANRAFIYFGETVITRKVSREQTFIRLAGMRDAQPLAQVEVVALDKDLRPISKKTTDEFGVATFSKSEVAGTEYFSALGTLQPLALADQFSGGYLRSQPEPPLRAYTLTDRPLYRPGQSVQFKGFVRDTVNDILKIPAGTPVQWKIGRASGGESLATGETKVDAEGGWHGLWNPPQDVPVGEFVLKAWIKARQAGSPVRFRIEEFRNPPFSVLCSEENPEKPAESVISVRSQYFHGAPNVGSRIMWTATWESDSDEYGYSGDDRMTRVDLYSEHAKPPVYSTEVSGEAILDGNGQAILRCENPFKDSGNRAHSRVYWKVDVTGPDGQTITGGTSQKVAMEPVLLGINDGDFSGGEVTFEWDAQEVFAKSSGRVNTEIFFIQTKTVKERLAPNVYRYRNFDQYTSVEKTPSVTGGTLKFKPSKPGRYIAVLSPLSGEPGFPVSEEVFVEGEGESEVPVRSDTSATVFSINVNGSRGDNKPWIVGEMADVKVLTPGRGVAWVTVETDKIHETYTAPITGNTSSIQIPVKPEYEPNVFVSVYIVRPGESNTLAGEMFGSTSLNVRAKDRILDIAVSTDRGEYEPRNKISGQVVVTAAGQPVPGADLAIYAVDDSILTLGGWQLPRMLSDFFPERNLAILTYSALKAYVDKIAPESLTMKGFVVGDGGIEDFGNVDFARKEFKPIILWQPSVKTDAQGVARFECNAPDNLTRFRVIAVGQTKGNQFGSGDSTFNVSKNLLVDTALPRFLRLGDEVELRAVVRQKVATSEKVRVRCTTGGSLLMEGEPIQEVIADRDAPVVVRFKATATDIGAATVKFDVISTSQASLTDSIEVTLPVTEPVILKREAVAGTVGNTTFAPREVAPGQWEGERGAFSFAASTTPWLPKLMGLPYLLDYPHGCFEQKSSKLLGYTYLSNLLEYLPDAKARKANYEKVIMDTLGEFETALLADGRLPYWPGGTQPNDFVTIQAAWCVTQAEAAGFAVPEHLSSELFAALETISADGETTPTLRAFALFVLSTFEWDSTEDVVAAANELFLQRDKLSGDGKAMLAIALYQLEIEPEKQKQLVGELPRDFENIAFNPATFGSATRTEALCAWARLAITPDDKHESLNRRLATLLESSAGLSTQENLWLLVAFDALLESASAAKLNHPSPRPDATSVNASAVAWDKRDLAKLAEFVVKGLKPGGSFVLRAEYRTKETQTPAISQGMKIDRVVKNLTDAARTGSPDAPFKLGDQILISYRFYSDKPQSYVAVEDLQAAGLEVINPDLAMFGEFYSVPPEPGVTASLSHSEMRDQNTNLYFDQMPAGTQSYSVLARATSAGTFIWPSTQIMPMYDSRFFGRSASSTCTVVAE